METVATVGFAIVFFLFIIVSIGLHEIGHMVPAKLFGVRVPQYFIGFGPTLFSRTKGETQYGFKAFPLGGYVRLLGMYPPASPHAGKPSRLAEFADEARAAEWDEISDEDVANNRLLYQKKTWQRVVVMFAGPFMNILICFAIMWGIVGFYGTYQEQPIIATVSACVLPATSTSQTCGANDPKSPAAQAGLKPGDTVVAFNGTQITSYTQLTTLIRDNMDGAATLTVLRGGQTITLPTVHTMVNQVASDTDPTATVQAGFLGVTPEENLVTGGPGDALSQMWTMTQQSVVALGKLPVSVWNSVVGMVEQQPRSLDSPMSIVGASWVAGEAVSAPGIDWQAKVVMFASLLASINLFLALFNLVPLPPLDGGHIAGAAYDWLRRQVAKLRRKVDPGPFDTAKWLPVAYAVTGFLIICGVALIVVDIVSPLNPF